MANDSIKSRSTVAITENIVDSGSRGITFPCVIRQHSATMALAMVIFPFTTKDGNYSYTIDHDVAFEGIGSFPVEDIHYKFTNFIVLKVTKSGTVGECFVGRHFAVLSYP